MAKTKVPVWIIWGLAVFFGASLGHDISLLLGLTSPATGSIFFATGELFLNKYWFGLGFCIVGLFWGRRRGSKNLTS